MWIEVVWDPKLAVLDPGMKVKQFTYFHESSKRLPVSFPVTRVDSTNEPKILLTDARQHAASTIVPVFPENILAN